MRRLALFITVIAALIGTITGFAQDDDGFTPFENTLFGVQGVVPIDWTPAAPGAYVRAQSNTDPTTIIVQSAPLPAASLQSALSQQFGIEEFPEAVRETSTDFGEWTIYEIDVSAGIEVRLTVALAEAEGTTYLVILQSAPDEHADLVQSVFEPVLDSVSLLEPDDEDAIGIPLVNATEEDVTFMSGDLELAGTLTIPDTEGPHMVVVLISGSGAQDRDASLAPIAEMKIFRDIANHLAANGIAVLRYDERGVGQSEGDIVSADLYDFRDDASAAVDYLASRDLFAAIGIVGHSEGGTYVPEIAVTNDHVDFAVGLAAPTVRVIDVTREQNQLLYASGGVGEEQLAAIDAAYGRVIEAVEDGDPDVLRTSVTDLLTAQLGEEPPEQTVDQAVAQFESPLIQSYVLYNPTPFWLDLDVPALAIYGTLDLQVSPEQNIPVIEGENENITIILIEGINHIFQVAETGGPDEYGDLDQTVSMEMLQPLTEWLLSLELESSR